MATTDWKQVGRQLESMGYPQNPAQPPAAQLSPAKPPAPQSGGVIGTANAQTAGPIGQPSPPQTQPVAASPAENPAQNFMPGTRAVFNESAKSISDLAGQGRYAAAAGETARAALAYVPAIADDVVGGAARAVVPAAVDAGKQFLTGGGSPAPAAPALASSGSPPTPAPATTPATATLNSALEAQRRRDAINGTGTGQSVPGASPETASAAPVGAGNVTRVGNSYSGTNVTGDNITINGQTPSGGFMVSGGLAARAMAQQSSASQRSPVGMTVEQAQQQGLIGERVGYNPAYDQRINGGQVYNPAYDQEFNQSSMGGGLAARALAQAAMQQRESYNPNVGSSSQWMGDLRDPRNLALRNASVGSTIFRNKGEEMMANKARQARVAGVQAAIGGQMHDAQAAQTAALQSKNTLAGNLATEQMRQDGENQRSLAQMALDQQKDRTAAAQWGAENRGKSLVQAMQEKIAAEQDPTKRKSLVQHMRDMQGGQTADPYLVVPGGQGLTEDGKPYNMPPTVFNRQTAQFLQPPQGQGRQHPVVRTPQDLDKLPQGAQFVGADGVVRTKN